MDREFYEDQGHEALKLGLPFHCSEATITDAVLRMVDEHSEALETVLDVGCGANLVYDRFLADMGKRPICIDFAYNFLRLAPRDGRMPLVQADATALPFPDASFDSVICSETIEHVPRDDSVIQEIARVLRPRGILVITAPNLWNAARLLTMIKQRDLAVRMMTGHLREYTPGHLRKLLRPYFAVEQWLPVSFGWSGKLGGPIDWLIHMGIFKRFSKSVAFVARRK